MPNFLPLFVTRAATLRYQQFRPLPFEEARRQLTRVLLDAVPVPGKPRRYAVQDAGIQIVAYAVERDGLLVVGDVQLAQDAHGEYPSSILVRDYPPIHVTATDE